MYRRAGLGRRQSFPFDSWIPPGQPRLPHEPESGCLGWRSSGLLLIAGAVLLTPASLQAGMPVRLLDDRGKSIDSEIQVCFSRALDTRCVQQAPWEPPEGFGDFDSASVEGPRHGPVLLSRADFVPDAKGQVVQRVPRKAVLTIQGDAARALTVSLYDRNDDTFRRPAFRYEWTGDTLMMPARPFLLSLFDGKSAPDLHLLSAEPGKAYVVAFRARKGWALLVRCRARTGGQAVSRGKVDVSVGLAPETDRRLMEATTEADGLGIVPAIDEPFVTLNGTAAGFLPLRERGIASSPGSFGYRELWFERGGQARAVVTIDGKPAAGGSCRVVATRLKRYEGPKRPEPEEFFAGRIDHGGVCETSPLRSGEYLLRIAPEADGAAAQDEPLTILDGLPTRIDVALRRIAVGGTVRRGPDVVPQAIVYVVSEEDLPRSASGRTTFPEPLRALTDQDGRYQGFVWKIGRYSFEVQPPGGEFASAAERSVDVWGDGAVVDLDLHKGEIAGSVVDREGSPVPSAWVVLSRSLAGGSTLYRRTWSDADGRFHYPIEAEGTIEAKAGKKGFETSDPVSVVIGADQAPSPITLVAKRLESLRGRVVSPTGSPQSNVVVSSYAVAGRRLSRLGDAVTDGDGRFSVARAQGAPTRLFASGPGCPLQVGDFGVDAADVALPCAASSSSLQLLMKTPEGKPVQDEWIILRWSGVLIPREVLMAHVAIYGMSFATDGTGRLALVALPPGEYQLFLGSGASEATISDGLPYGMLGTARLDPGAATEVELEVRFKP